MRRTTITFDDDTAAAVEQLRKQRHVGVSEVVNDLVRKGLRAGARSSPFRQRSAPIGVQIDIRNTEEALDIAEGPHRR